jgi:protein-tyrosine phosphatase
MNRVLFVCLGNICRSPTAEGVFRDLHGRESPGLAVEADSAGTAAYHLGSPPDPRSRRAALRRGIEIGHLRARQITPADFGRFDLILAMDADNLRDLQAMCPPRSRARLMPFLKFAPQLGTLEVPDPYYGGEEGFERVLDLTTAASRGLLEWLEQRA